MDLKDPQVQKSMVIGMFLAMIAYVYFFTSFMPFLYKPRAAKEESLKREYDKVSTELEKARKTVGNLEALETEYNRLHEKWVAALKLLPEEDEIAGLLRKITMAGNQAGVNFTLFEPKRRIRKDFFAENPINIRVKGRYHQVGIFLSKVANLDRIVNVSDMEISSFDNKDDGGVGKTRTIEAQMTMTAYTLLKGG
ncbi:MAG TPA: type 4a pilus biogenesis protein PilO, partial [Candidatus Krumholzibacteriaceae bacterium]|nr:type 4a pilus biogenesis protein PilO [Candidatus Krumholzibacteriaceae bacterium]